MEINRKKIPSYLMILTIILTVLIFNFSYFKTYISANSDEITNYTLSDEDINPVREAAVAGLFYPADLYQLDKDIDGYLEHVSSNLSSRPHIMIVPHAGYKYSGAVAAYAYKRLQPFKKQIKTVFLLGPSHYVFVDGVALSPDKQFKTPLGLVTANEALTATLKNNKLFKISKKAHKKEHSLEVQMPFLQKTLDNFTIVPMLYGEADAAKIAEALKPYLQDDSSLLIVSADLSHYLDYDTAQKIDGQTAKQIQKADAVSPHQSCGATGINTAMILAREFGLVPQLLDMVNSGDVTGDKDRVVGYGAWVYQEPEEEKELSGIELEQAHLKNFARHHKEQLLDIARKSLISAVEKSEPFLPRREEFNDFLFNKGASFVTLNKKGKLRGCIGSPLPFKSIAADIADNAYAAAMADSRFSPVTSDELKDIDFSISLLTGFEEIEFKSYEDLLSEIHKDIDGILLKDGQREALFLPAVWKELPEKDEFISQLKIKAGLAPSYWSDQIKVFRFRTVEIKNDKN